MAISKMIIIIIIIIIIIMIKIIIIITATMTRTLYTQYIDPMTIEPLVANRLIPLGKGEGAVRPIGVGEVLRRICGKCVMSVAKKGFAEASGSLQLCAGQKSGSEATIHAMRLR